VATTLRTLGASIISAVILSPMARSDIDMDHINIYNATSIYIAGGMV